MADYTITFARSARKELERLPGELAARLLEKVGALARNPRPGGTSKLRGQKQLWRLRVGDYRVVLCDRCCGHGLIERGVGARIIA